MGIIFDIFGMTQSWLEVGPGINPGLPGEQVVCDQQDDNNHTQTPSQNFCSASWKSYRWRGHDKHSRRRCVYQGCQDCVRSLPKGGYDVCSSYIRRSSVKLLRKRSFRNWLYERWLPDSLTMLLSRTLLRTVFTKSVRGNSYTTMTWDMWIKCTINKGS